MNCETVAFGSFCELKSRRGKKQKGEILMAVISMKQLLEAGVHFGQASGSYFEKLPTTSFHRKTNKIT